MEAHQILQSNILDILFEGKNKAYGAYDLRNTYNKRITMALIIMIAIICLLVISSTIANRMQPIEVNNDWVSKDRVLINPDEPKLPEPKLPKPKTTILPPVATVKVTTPKIVKDNDVLQPPPDVEEIANSKIDIKTTAGIGFDGVLAPPEGEIGTQIIAGMNTKKQNPDSIFLSVQIDATFPGGTAAWHKYVSNAIMKELDEFTNTDFGTCTVQFIVDKNGNVSDVHALNMKGTKLAEIAVNCIRKGPKWNPAIQNGTKVNAYRRQPVTLVNPGM